MENVEQTSQASQAAPERAARSARFFSNLHRWRSLLRRMWWIPLITTSLGVSVQWFILSNAAPVYVSIGQMIVSIRLNIPEGSAYMEEWSNFTGTQAALMQSGQVLNMARERLRLIKPGLKGVPPEIKVAISPKTTIFVLKASGGEPEYTREFLQACMDSYIEFKSNMRSETSETTLKGITEELSRKGKELANAEEELAAYQSSNSVVFLTEQGNSAAAYFTILSRQHADLRKELDLLTMLTLEQNIDRQRQGTTEPRSDTGASPNTGIEMSSDSQQYSKVSQEITLLKVERAERSEFWKPLHPKMVKLNEDIARSERLLTTLREQGQEKLADYRSRLSLTITNLEQKITEWKAKALDASGKIAEYEKLKNGKNRIQSMYDRLLATMQTLDVNKTISPESVTIMQPATPSVVDSASLLKSLALAGLAGLAIGGGILFLLNQLDDRLNSYTELRGEFDEEVLGQIPRDRQARRGGDAQLIRREDDRHAFMEAYRNLRSSLLYLSSTGARPKTILVTSSIPNDGKSMTTANLAITMALSGSKVLLVDGDLRKGVQHQRFGLQSTPGLSEALGEDKTWQEHVQATRIANLFLLSRGATTQHSSELFLNPRTMVFLKDASASYDFVILDSPPVMAADDVTSLAPNVDGVIFVIRAQQTSARVAHAALELLYQRRVNVLGLVFNAVEANVSEYYYYKYRDYYSSYPSK